MDLFEKRFVINTGKGGVGKSTISAAMALAAARRQKRVLVIELNTKERISRLFGVPEVGSEITQIHERIWAVNITPHAAMREYGHMKIKTEIFYKAVFENRFVKQFLRVIPGLNDLVLIGKAWYHEQERDAMGRPKYDFIVVDAPATGHGLFFLRIPRVITDAVGSGDMAHQARQILDLLQDSKRTALNIITLTEEMPVNETIDLKQEIDATLRMPMGYLIANGIYPTLFTPQEAVRLDELADSHGNPDDLTGRLLEAGHFRHERCELQAGYLDKLRRKVAMPLIEVPFIFDPHFNFETVRRIASNIEASVSQTAEER